MKSSATTWQPLANRLRPQHLSEFVGQSHLLQKNKPLEQAIRQRKLYSMILWGPPGSGKTTLARLLINAACAHMEQISAVTAGVKDIREIIKKAEKRKVETQQATVLFVDEVHRFNKAQQDAFLPHVESGLLTLIGATTENPSFALNNALLSRSRVYILKPLNEKELSEIFDRALEVLHQECESKLVITPEMKQYLVNIAEGDARKGLNFLEMLDDFVNLDPKHPIPKLSDLKAITASRLAHFDNKGEEFYNTISALHKAVRGSDPDAALYWLVRMLEGGADPYYIMRRMVRMASEDIGNADPKALEMALNAWQSYERLGSPEGDLVLAQAIIYLAVAPKSNASYAAYKAALKDVKEFGSLEVPLHIRNAPTLLMKNLNYGKDYQYDHDTEEGYSGQEYFPDPLIGRRYYYPVARGLEVKIQEILKKHEEKKSKINK